MENLVMKTTKRCLLAAIGLTIATTQGAMASGRAVCPGAIAGPGWAKNEGIIVTKSTDMTGQVSAEGATRCTIKFQLKHRTSPYCNVSGPEVHHITSKVLRTSPTEVTFVFSSPLPDEDGY
jgi:hypothetical protein